GLALALKAPDAGFPSVRGDRERLVQVFGNLILNAVKHTPAGGRVEVAAVLGEGPRQGSVVFSVRDSGRGIALEDQRRVFDRFVQLASAPRREGVGLGLAIVRELVTRQGGEVWVESAPGKG